MTGNLNSRGINNPMSGKSIFEAWTKKFGALESEKLEADWRNKMSIATTGENNPMFGKNYQTHGWKRENIRRKGLTFEKIFGEIKAKQIKASLSKKQSGELNAAYGKVYENCGISRCQGTYLGIRFRSKYELSFLVHLTKMGTDMNRVKSEPFFVRYMYNNKQRTYRPDFMIDNVVYEIKPSNLLEYKENPFKFASALQHCNEHGLDFKIITEKDFCILTLEKAILLDVICWNKGALEYLNGRINRDRGT